MTANVLLYPSSSPDPHAFRCVLQREGRIRLYEIRPAGHGAYQTWVRFNGQPHRAKLTSTLVEVATIKAQFLREIAELELDGWTR